MDNNRILEKLKELRLSKGITEDQAAQHINITLEAFRKIENGVNNSVFKYWIELIEYYGSNMEEFMKTVTGNNIIFKDNTMETGYVHSLHHYADKPMVKSLLSEKDKVMKMQDAHIIKLEKDNQEKDHRIQDLLKIIEKMLGHPPRPKDLVVGK